LSVQKYGGYSERTVLHFVLESTPINKNTDIQAVPTLLTTPHFVQSEPQSPKKSAQA